MKGLIGGVAVIAFAAAGTSAAQGDQAERASDKRDKMICKKFVETGSLVRGYRTCKTKAEWERERDNLRAAGAGGNSCREPGAGTCGI